MARYPFLTHIEAAWTKSIEEDYDKHTILSERALQASLWAHLKNKAKGQFIFIEPKIQLPPLGDEKPRTTIPDIVVCRGRSIIAVIELKFAPRGKPDFKADIVKLQSFYANKSTIELALPRFMGIKVKDHSYKITNRTQFVLGCICNKLPSGLDSFLEGIENEALKGRFAVLMAETIEGKECQLSQKRF